MIAAGPQSTCAANDEVQAGDAVDEAGEHVLERVRALQVLRQRDTEDREQQDPLRGAEVAAVDARQVDRERREHGAAALEVDLALASASAPGAAAAPSAPARSR